MTHYELLGIQPTASAAQVREAYRRAARANHPDTHGDRTADRMAAINEAWRVLQDPERRRVYDQVTLRDPSRRTAEAPRPAPTTAAGAEPAYNPFARYQDPPRFPWRFMAVLLAIGVGVVMIGVITYHPSAPAPVDNLLRTGDCVNIDANGDAREVLCSQPHDAVVAVLVPFGTPCASGTEPHRDRQGMGTACVRRP